MAIVAEGVAQLLFSENGRLSADITSELRTATWDQEADKAENGFALLVYEVTTATGAADDTVTFVIDIDDSPDDSTYTTRQTLTRVVTVDDNDAEHTGYIVVPIRNLNGLARYVQASVITTHQGTGSISASAGALMVAGSEARDNPQGEYAATGFGEETIN